VACPPAIRGLESWLSRSDGVRVALAIVVALMAAPVPAVAEDADAIRYYLAIHLGDTTRITDAHDGASLSAGVNLTRYFGAELALDKYELHIDSHSHGKVGEAQIFSILPELRARYPLLHDRLVPYGLLGLGPSVDHINDVVIPSSWKGGGADRVRLTGAFGAGIEYYVTDDIAFGFEWKWYVLGSATYVTKYPSDRIDVDLDSGFLTFGVRLLYPELHPDEESPAWEGGVRSVYLNARFGGALDTKNEVFPGVKTKQSHRMFGTDFGRIYGVALGAHLAPWADVEIAPSYNELSLEYPNGTHSEYAMFSLPVQARLHYVLPGSRWDPYVLGGVGPQIAELNDSGGFKSTGVDGSHVAVMGTAGAGVDYRLTTDSSAGFETKYVRSRGQTLTVYNGPELSGNLDSLVLWLGVRAFFATF
jgi:opacity protein-like surface antigen